MELCAILAMLHGHALVYASLVSISSVTAIVLCRSSDLAMLLNSSHASDFHDCHADRCDNHATRDRQEPVHSKRRGEECAIVLYKFISPIFF